MSISIKKLSPSAAITVLGELVNPHRERQTISRGQTLIPPKSFFTPTAKARQDKAAIATAAEAPGTTHRARPPMFISITTTRGSGPYNSSCCCMLFRWRRVYFRGVCVSVLCSILVRSSALPLPRVIPTKRAKLYTVSMSFASLRVVAVYSVVRLWWPGASWAIWVSEVWTARPGGGGRSCYCHGIGVCSARLVFLENYSSRGPFREKNLSIPAAGFFSLFWSSGHC